MGGFVGMGRILLWILVGDISGAEEIEGLGVEDKMRLQEEEATKTIFQMKFRSKSLYVHHGHLNLK